MTLPERACLAVALVAGVIAFGSAHGPVSLDAATGVLLYSTGATSTLSGSCGATLPAATAGTWATCVMAPPDAH